MCHVSRLRSVMQRLVGLKKVKHKAPIVEAPSLLLHIIVKLLTQMLYYSENSGSKEMKSK